MNKIFALGGIVLLFLCSIIGFGKENGDLNTQKNLFDEPQAIIGQSQNNNLPLKTYIASYVVEGDGEVSSTLVLKNNNEFALSANEYINHVASGKYTIDNEKLLLTVTDNEVYIFIIDDDKLIFESGTWLENWVKQGTVFHLKIESDIKN